MKITLEVDLATDGAQIIRLFREAVRNSQDNHTDGTVPEKGERTYCKREGCCGHDPKTGYVIREVHDGGVSTSSVGDEE